MKKKTLKRPNMNDLPSSLHIIGGLLGIALVPFAAVMLTSFVKVAVVLSLVRNALGVQQIPPNIVIYGIAIILSVFIMAPVALEISNVIASFEDPLGDADSAYRVLEEVSAPITAFLIHHTPSAEAEFFIAAAHDMWPPQMTEDVSAEHILIAVPSFVVAELSSAFQLGFLLYLPFIVIDMVVSNILLALGMMMVSPATISLPLKLLLFVAVDGWSLILIGLIQTYH